MVRTFGLPNGLCLGFVSGPHSPVSVVVAEDEAGPDHQPVRGDGCRCSVDPLVACPRVKGSAAGRGGCW